MSRFVLKNHGYPYKVIVSKRRQVGRVIKTRKGYQGIIGDTKAEAPTELDAFHEVVARHLGYPSAVHLAARNREVRRAKSIRRRDMNARIDALLRGERF